MYYLGPRCGSSRSHGDRWRQRAIVVTLPVLLLTIMIQKEIVVGLTAGGVKGA